VKYPLQNKQKTAQTKPEEHDHMNVEQLLPQVLAGTELASPSYSSYISRSHMLLLP